MFTTLWLTGLPSAGKTTLAKALLNALPESLATEHLDGDAVRGAVFPELGFSDGDRHESIRRTGWLASRIARHGPLVIVSAIAPFIQGRNSVRATHHDQGLRFIEVHVNAPLQVCIARDVKGLYTEVALGKRSGVTGLDAPYEAPDQPDLVLYTAEQSVDECVEALLACIFEEPQR